MKEVGPSEKGRSGFADTSVVTHFITVCGHASTAICEMRDASTQPCVTSPRGLQ